MPRVRPHRASPLGAVRTRRAALPAVRLVAVLAALALAAALFGVLPVQGQSTTTFVKNTGQTAGSGGYLLDATNTQRLQNFTTGPNDKGYTLTSIGVNFYSIASVATAGSELTVTLEGDSALCTLTDPASFTTAGVQTFTAPPTGTGACPTLTKETTYVVVVTRANNTSDLIGLAYTHSGSEDLLTPATGWEIADDLLYYSTELFVVEDQSYIIEVRGTAENTAATGAPTITGVAGVGQELTASTAGISDADGLDNVSYSYQWLRVDGMTETPIGTDSPTYTLVDNDEGTYIKVTVSFADDAGNAESRTSPAVGSVTPVAFTLVKNTGQSIGGLVLPLSTEFSRRAQAFTTGPNDKGYTPTSIGLHFRQIASVATAGSELTVTLNEDSSGVPGSALCTLADPASFTTAGLQTFIAPTTGTDPCPALTKETTYFVVVTRANNTTDFIEWSYTGSGGVEDTLTPATGWEVGGRSWYETSWSSSGTRSHIIEVRGTAENTPAAGAPGIAEVGQELTASTSGISDADGLDNASYSYQWLRVEGMSETNIGSDSSTYTLVADDEGKAIRVTVSFSDDAGNAESLTSRAVGLVTKPATTFVKNTGQTAELGSFPLTTNFSQRAQAFTTGPNDKGYTLTSIGVWFSVIFDTATAGSELTVTLNADSSGVPGSSALCTLADPASFSASGLHTFTAPTKWDSNRPDLHRAPDAGQVLGQRGLGDDLRATAATGLGSGGPQRMETSRTIVTRLHRKPNNDADEPRTASPRAA